VIEQTVRETLPEGFSAANSCCSMARRPDPRPARLARPHRGVLALLASQPPLEASTGPA
jgi:hypothetical protein